MGVIGICRLVSVGGRRFFGGSVFVLVQDKTPENDMRIDFLERLRLTTSYK